MSLDRNRKAFLQLVAGAGTLAVLGCGGTSTSGSPHGGGSASIAGGGVAVRRAAIVA